MGLKILAPAKINLGLEIGEKNKNGYHEVDMVMQSISLFDEMELIISSTGTIEIEIDKKLNCPPGKNIAYRAAREFFEYTKISGRGIKIKIKKSIPMFAGLAGGSADGAGVIIGLNKIFETNLELSEMCKIGEKVGSDVPFCIIGGAACARGTGTNLTSINTLPHCNILVVKPFFSVSTFEAYSRFDSMKMTKERNMNALVTALELQDLSGVCANLYNRFEEIVDNEEVFEIKNKLQKSGALGALMTGSGSAVYGVFENRGKAEICLQDLCGRYEFVSLAQPLNHGAFLI